MRPHIWSLKLWNRWSDIDHDSLPESHPLSASVLSVCLHFQHALGASIRVADSDVADEVDNLPEALLVERGPGVLLGQHILEHRGVPFDWRPLRPLVVDAL